MVCGLGTRGGNDNKGEILKLVYADVWRGPSFVDGANVKVVKILKIVYAAS